MTHNNLKIFTLSHLYENKKMTAYFHKFTDECHEHLNVFNFIGSLFQINHCKNFFLPIDKIMSHILISVVKS